VWGAVAGLAVAIGPLLGGLLTTGLSWRWIFFVNAPIGIAAVVISVFKVAESRSPHASRPEPVPAAGPGRWRERLTGAAAANTSPGPGGV